MDNAANLSLNLLKCVKSQDLDGVRRYLFRGANPNFPALPGGISAMHFAAGTNFHQAAHLMLLSGGNPNIRSADGLTPVLISAAWGAEEVFRLLLLHGGDPSLQDKDGINALGLALDNKQERIVYLIHQSSASFASSSTSGAGDSDSGSSEYFTVDEFLCIDSDSNVAFVEQFAAPSSARDSSSDSLISLDDATLRDKLRLMGENPGPITPTTRRIYVRQLRKLCTPDEEPKRALPSPMYSNSLQGVLTGDADPTKWKHLEEKFSAEFGKGDQKWPGGMVRTSFIYFLLDPRVLRNLTLQFSESTVPPVSSDTFREAFATFMKAVFYVGKGQMHRAYDHFCEALKARKSLQKQTEVCAKVARILDIWDADSGVISLHCFQGLTQAEAYSREACIIDAIGLPRLTNVRSGQYYGSTSACSLKHKTRIGCLFLIRAFYILLQEGERQIHPINVKQT